jgi:hypothetical protein
VKIFISNFNELTDLDVSKMTFRDLGPQNKSPMEHRVTWEVLFFTQKFYLRRLGPQNLGPVSQQIFYDKDNVPPCLKALDVEHRPKFCIPLPELNKQYM